jgi:hypothetical protein
MSTKKFVLRRKNFSTDLRSAIGKEEVNRLNLLTEDIKKVLLKKGQSWVWMG